MSTGQKVVVVLIVVSSLLMVGLTIYVILGVRVEHSAGREGYV